MAGVFDLKNEGSTRTVYRMTRRASVTPPRLERVGDGDVPGGAVVQGAGRRGVGGARCAAARAHDLLVPLGRATRIYSALIRLKRRGSSKMCWMSWRESRGPGRKPGASSYTLTRLSPLLARINTQCVVCPLPYPLGQSWSVMAQPVMTSSLWTRHITLSGLSALLRKLASSFMQLVARSEHVCRCGASQQSMESTAPPGGRVVDCEHALDRDRWEHDLPSG